MEHLAEQLDAMTTEHRTIYIAGCGCISNAGDGCAETLRGLYAPVNPPSMPPEWVGTTLKLPLFALTRFPLHEPSRTIALLEHAVAEALAETAVPIAKLRKYRVGLTLGTTVACQLNNIPFYAKLRRNEIDTLEPLKRYLHLNSADRLREKYGFRGPVSIVSNACASGADAVALAARWIESGRCDIAVASGADELNRVPVAGFHALGVASSEPCRPFDADRSGLNLGEGAGAVVLMNEKTFRELMPADRSPRMVLAGYGQGGDAYHITSPHSDGRGLERAVRQALARAGLRPEEIAFLNAHGTGTRTNDFCESSLFARIFGPEVRFLSTKGMTGHTLGAAGVLELIFSMIMLREKRLPASPGFRRKEEEMPLAPVAEETAFSGHFAMSTSLGFGGCNTALIVGEEE